MGIAKSLTNDLERALRFYRLPILTAMAFSLRQVPDDRFLLTDSRNEDFRRNVYKLKKISKIEQKSCAPGIGVDERQFTSMTNMLVFTGLKDENGVVQPIGNVTNLGGRADTADVLWSSTGTSEQKEQKLKRYAQRRPGDVSWRIRTPIMMADETSVIDYLAFRCTQLPFLHSIALKWSDRRWDGSAVGIDEDLYRQANEKTQMIVFPPVWMDPSRKMLDPNIWGPYQSIITANYNEYLGRKMDEWMADCVAFVDCYQEYTNVSIQTETENHTRVQRFLDTNLNKTLHIPFNRNIKGDGKGNDTYRVIAFDPSTGQNVTQDIFNLQDAKLDFRLTNSFEGKNLSEDGWCGTAATQYSSDIPENLPAFAKDREGNDVFGTKSIRLTDGFIARRMTLPDGKYSLSFWVKSENDISRIELIRNTRLKTKSQTMLGDRELSAKHFRESYETLATSVIRKESGWRKVWVSFDLVDHFNILGEPYPKHEVFIVLQTEGIANFDHIELFLDYEGHGLRIFNSVNRSTIPYTVRPELKHVDLEEAFRLDTAFGERELAGAFFRFDGSNIACELDSRESYNLKPTGTTINTWLKINSAEEEKNRILKNRGVFTIFQKTGVNVPGYVCSVNSQRVLNFVNYNQTIVDSTKFNNHFLQPNIGTDAIPHRLNWSDPNQYENFIQAFTQSGKQPMEWVDYQTIPSGKSYIAYADTTKTNLGAGKTIIIDNTDPYFDEVVDDFFINGGIGYLPDGTEVNLLPGQAIDLKKYLLWHATQAYKTVVPEEDVAPNGMSSGFVFLPVPINTLLNTVGQTIGNYSPSPGGWPFPPVYFSPGTSPEFPISPKAWGSPFYWPSPDVSPNIYSPRPEWHPFAWESTQTYNAMVRRYPMFMSGIISFDRWFNFDVAVDSTGYEISIAGTLVQKGNLTFPEGSNKDRLLIGNSAPESINGGSPISVYSFKIFQRKNSVEDRISIVNGESTNFNDIQYNMYAENLDVDNDRQLDFWQDDSTDLGLWVTSPSVNPTDPKVQYGKIKISTLDPLSFRTDYDHDRTTIADWFDGSYLQELIDIQVAGFGDGLLLWDFAHQDQETYHGYSDRVWDPICRSYKDRKLSYYDWLMGVLNEEWNSITSIHDPIPGQSDGTILPDPSPAHSPMPEGSPAASFGATDDQLVLTGAKGWFGFNALLGYRDSLELLRKEGLIFNYLQIEFRFQAPREELERLLKDYAKSYEQIFNDDYPKNRLTKKSPR